MNSMQYDVHDFLVKHLGLDPDNSGWPTPAGIFNKWLLIEEEVRELRHALGIWGVNNYDVQRLDEPAVIKELCDVLYVIFNMCEELKIDITPFFDAVHKSNMTKTPAALSETRKILKGPDYVAPDIPTMLAAYRAGQKLEALAQSRRDTQPTVLTASTSGQRSLSQ